MKQVIILGTGGNSLDIIDALFDINTARGAEIYRPVGFLDDNPARRDFTYRDIPVLGPLSLAQSYPDHHFINGIGNPNNYWKKEAILGETGIPLERFETVIHPTAVVSRSAVIGRGTVLLPYVTIAAKATVGNHVVVLPQTVINHDDVVGDFSCIATSACISGGVQIGASCYLGCNCSIIQNITIGDRSLVGIGSIVIRDVPEDSIVVGNPARVLRQEQRKAS